MLTEAQDKTFVKHETDSLITIATDYYEETDTYIITDLLADVIIYPDGFVKVVDIGELADAREAGLLNDAMLKKALLTLNRLLQVIYDGGFEKLQEPLEKYG